MASDFHFPLDEAETTLMGLLDRRDAISSEPGYDLHNPDFLAQYHLDQAWVDNSVKAYGWRTRTPLAIVLCGLLARATNADVDPLSLQEGSGDFGYNASGLWKDIIIKHASGRVSLRKLKDQPFNNSPFNGKRRLSTGWENVSEANVRPIGEAYAMLVDVAKMTPAAAEAALLAVLMAAPAPSGVGLVQDALFLDSQYPTLVALTEFADGVAKFILLNSDDGRRAQAFVAACLEVALPERTTTPASIHDPSRTSPGDVKSIDPAGAGTAGPLFVEVKDKVVRRKMVERFLKEVRDHDVAASAGYAALANTVDAESKLDDSSRIPSSQDLTRSSTIPTVVWKSPLELLTQTAVWSALPSSTVVWVCAHNYRKWLAHLDTGKNNSPQEWDDRLRAWGFLDL